MLRLQLHTLQRHVSMNIQKEIEPLLILEICSETKNEEREPEMVLVLLNAKDVEKKSLSCIEFSKSCDKIKSKVTVGRVTFFSWYDLTTFAFKASVSGDTHSKL